MYTTIKIRENATNKKYYYKETNDIEIKAVFALLYLAGMFRANNRNLDDIWRNDGTRTMSAKRFMFLLTYLRFDNIGQKEEQL